MENKYLLVALLAVPVVFAINVASAHSIDGYNNSGNGFSMSGMGGMMGMMQGTNGFVHDKDDIGWMKNEMKEHMNLTNEEVDEITGHCPMIRSR